MTLRPAQLLRGLAVAVFLVAWALLAHFGSAGEGSADISVLLGVSPFMAAVGLLLWRTRHPLLAGGGNLAMLGAIVWLWPTLRQNVALIPRELGLRTTVVRRPSSISRPHSQPN